MQTTLGVVIATDGADRLHPLTQNRPVAAIPFGGKYRVIDFVLSNCVNSGLRQVMVLSQFRFHSLMKHLRDGWHILNPELGEYVTLVPPQMRRDEDWYLNTADALHQNLDLLERNPADTVLLLPGNQIYRMDFAALRDFHNSMPAEVTLVCTRASGKERREGHRVQVNDLWQIQAIGDAGELCSEGVMMVNKNLLIDYLKRLPEERRGACDLVRDLVQDCVGGKGAQIYIFGGDKGRVSPDRYWRTIHTLDDYFEASMDLLAGKLDINQADWKIRGVQRQLPASHFRDGPDGETVQIKEAIIGSGAELEGCRIENAIIGSGVRVAAGAEIVNAVVLDDARIEANCSISNCIIDKGRVIARGTRLSPYGLAKYQGKAVLSPGGVVVPR